MALIRVLSRLALIVVTVVLLAFVVFNYASFLVTVQSLGFRYWVGSNDLVQAPETPLFVFCAGFFVLGVLLMGLASMQVYLDLVGSWRRLRKERRAYEPERRELERVRASLAREREDHEPKRRELDFRATELDHRAEALKRDREALAESRTHLASERADLAKERAELAAERNAVERDRAQVDAARAAMARERGREASAANVVEAVPLGAVDVPAQPLVASRSSSEATTPTTEDSVHAPSWDLAERLDDDVAAVARLAQESHAEASDGEPVEGAASPDGSDGTDPSAPAR